MLYHDLANISGSRERFHCIRRINGMRALGPRGTHPKSGTAARGTVSSRRRAGLPSLGSSGTQSFNCLALRRFTYQTALLDTVDMRREVETKTPRCSFFYPLRAAHEPTELATSSVLIFRTLMHA